MGSRGGSRSRSGSMSGGGDFGRAVARAAVAQMLEAAGFACAHRSAVDALVDVLLRYVGHLGRAATFHANLAGRAIPNECDVVQFLEEFGADYQGFAGASSPSDGCLVNSGVVMDIAMFVSTSNDKPFVRTLPRFPVQRAPPQSAASFAVLGRSGMKHVPEWLPNFPEPHTYLKTEACSEKVDKAGVGRLELMRQRRKAEKSLASLQQRLALAGADGFRPAVAEDDFGKGKELDVVGGQHNPFRDPAWPYGEKEVSEVAMPNSGKQLAVLEAFAPVLAASEGEKLEGGFQDQDQTQKRIVPNERPPVYLRLGINRKPMVMAPNSTLLEEQNGPSFRKEEDKDDRKQRVELILREAMDNPQELTLL